MVLFEDFTQFKIKNPRHEPRVLGSAKLKLFCLLSASFSVYLHLSFAHIDIGTGICFAVSYLCLFCKAL